MENVGIFPTVKDEFLRTQTSLTSWNVFLPLRISPYLTLHVSSRLPESNRWHPYYKYGTLPTELKRQTL